nr:hypothetical protein Iba_chr01bCG1260 [Ipomoea batatas]
MSSKNHSRQQQEHSDSSAAKDNHQAQLQIQPSTNSGSGSGLIFDRSVADFVRRPPLKLGFATDRIRRQSAWWARGPYFSALLSEKQDSRVESFGAATPGPRGQRASCEGLRLPHLMQLPCLCEMVASR